jgi:hypothetical protein
MVGLGGSTYPFKHELRHAARAPKLRGPWISHLPFSLVPHSFRHIGKCDQF